VLRLARPVFRRSGHGPRTSSTHTTVRAPSYWPRYTASPSGGRSGPDAQVAQPGS
jgi:hypothetical protein